MRARAYAARAFHRLVAQQSLLHGIAGQDRAQSVPRTRVRSRGVRQRVEQRFFRTYDCCCKIAWSRSRFIPPRHSARRRFASMAAAADAEDANFLIGLCSFGRLARSTIICVRSQSREYAARARTACPTAGTAAGAHQEVARGSPGRTQYVARTVSQADERTGGAKSMGRINLAMS